MHWRRKWQPTPVFLLRESQGQRSLLGCRLWVAQSRTWLKWLSSMEFLISISYCTWHFISMLTLNPRGNSLREMFFFFYRRGHGVSERLSALSHKLQSLICIQARLQSRYFYSPINYTSCRVILPQSSLMEVTVVIRSIWLDSSPLFFFLTTSVRQYNPGVNSSLNWSTPVDLLSETAAVLEPLSLRPGARDPLCEAPKPMASMGLMASQAEAVPSQPKNVWALVLSPPSPGDVTASASPCPGSL